MKNAFVLAPLAFSQRFFDAEPRWQAILAFASFCLAASATYAFNDIVDRDRDRNHPLKSKRPLASGRVSLGAARALAGVLTIAAVALGTAIDGAFLIFLLAFIVLQLAYSLGVKGLLIGDVVAIALGFVLRAAAGITAIDGKMSPWLFICTFLLAAFLGFGKRRHELTLLGDGAAEHREVLGRYSVPLLDRLLAAVAVLTVLVYGLYATSPEVAGNLGTERLYLTVPFVVCGVFRYLFLIYRREKGGNPTALLLGDAPLQVAIALWTVTVFWLLYD